MLAARISPHLHQPRSWIGDRRHSPLGEKPRAPPVVRFRPLRCAPWGLRYQLGARRSRVVSPRAGLAPDPVLMSESPGLRDGTDSGEVLLEKTFTLNRAVKVEGKISVRFDPGNKDGTGKGRLTIGCNLEGNWLLHWGVRYENDIDSEWDLPPSGMAPAGSVSIKDYATETPFRKSSPDLLGNTLNEVTFDLDLNSPVAAIHFVLKEKDTGVWYQNQGEDFIVKLYNDIQEDTTNKVGQKHVNIWKEASSQIANLLNESNGSHHNHSMTGATEVLNGMHHNHKNLEAFYEEFPISKEEIVQNSASIFITASAQKSRNFLHFDTDVPGKVILHWGVCREDTKKWEVPSVPLPPQSRVFRNKAVRTPLQQKSGGVGSWGVLPLEKNIDGVLFVLKLEDRKWLTDMGEDFYIPLAHDDGLLLQGETEIETSDHALKSSELSGNPLETDEIINDIRNLVTDISTEKKMITTSKEAQESILEEIEKLAAEAYSIFRSSTPAFVEDIVTETERIQISTRTWSASGSGHEILCQGFNWESHASGKWYCNLRDKASDLYNLGVTAIWLPPPTESISPQGYMPKDLYNLNSSYGSVDDLKNLINALHEFDIKVVGDVVLNHRCAHYQNKNGIWNIFGGQLNWDDRAVVSDDPHFQGRGNKSSGEQFHAAPNIDHSQEFVRNDLKEWLCWLRQDIAFDGWRLDFVRGFWGGYMKDYMEASKPEFAVGEFWDSLSYTYGQMDHNQDAHRQRIIDWINATNGTSGAFDITTKGILHVTLDNCEYWRLSDEKGKPPGLIGWWPSRAVTFIENHDTGSTQGHWRFPCGKEMQGYAYILTHPGTPTVFYDHVFSHFQQEIGNLISIRRRLNINCRSTVRIKKAEKTVYAAEIDEKLMIKIGPEHYEPSDNRRWKLCAEGREYKIWELA